MATSVQTGPQPPSIRPHSSTEDLQEHFAALTAKTPVDSAFRKAFLHSKIRLAHTHPSLDIASRDQAVQNVIKVLGPEACQLDTFFALEGLEL